MNKYQYKFEIEESMNDNIGFYEVDSLETALKKIRQDGKILAIYEYPIDDGKIYREVVKLDYDFKQKSEKEIYEYLDNQVDSIQFQNK